MKNKCPICGTEYTHLKRLITHMAKGSCGLLAGQLGIKLDIDKRLIRGKNLEKKPDESETIEETEDEVVKSVVVETDKPRPDTNDIDDSEPEPKPKRTRKIKETLDCPRCESTILFNRTPEETYGVIQCPTCKSDWEWEA